MILDPYTIHPNLFNLNKIINYATLRTIHFIISLYYSPLKVIFYKVNNRLKSNQPVYKNLNLPVIFKSIIIMKHQQNQTSKKDKQASKESWSWFRKNKIHVVEIQENQKKKPKRQIEKEHQHPISYGSSKLQNQIYKKTENICQVNENINEATSQTKINVRPQPKSKEWYWTRKNQVHPQQIEEEPQNQNNLQQKPNKKQELKSKKILGHQQSDSRLVNNYVVYENIQRDEKAKSQTVANELPVQQISQANKCAKIFLVLVTILIILSILGSILFLLIFFYKHSDPKTKQHRSPYIFLPEYQKNEVFDINYTITNTMSQDYYVRVNYTVYFVTANIETDQKGERIQTTFQASMQKRSQEKITTKNQTVQDVQFFDNSTTFEDILKKGINSLDKLTQGEVGTQSNSSTCQQMKSSLNQSADQSIICQEPVLWVFNFTLLANGKIKQLTFPVKMPKQQLGLIRTFIKMFSPLLDKKVYEEEGTPQSEVKPLKSNFFNDDKLESNNSYQQNSNYTYNNNQNNTTLSENTKVNVQSDTQNTKQQSSQSIAFKDGKPKSGFLSSQTSFMPSKQEKESKDTLYSPKPTPINLNFTSNQKCSFKVIETFITDNQKQFAGFLGTYKEQNNTKTTNVQGLIDFILGESSDPSKSQIAPGKTRVLLENDGSFKIIGYDKKVTLVKTNVIGFKIAAFGYFELDINMRQDPRNKQKKNIQLLSEVGTILSLGSSKHKIPLYKYKKQLPPLNLKFTLQKIQSIFDLLKGDFLANVLKIKNAIFSGHLEESLLPEIAQVVSVVANLTTGIDYQKKKNSPTQKLNEIYSIVQQLWNIYDTKGMSLINNDNQTITTLVTGLLQYVNVSYKEALNIFQQSKGKLDGLRQNAIVLFQGSSNQFLNHTVQKVKAQVNGLIPKQLYDKYESEIKKVKIIFDAMDYYKTYEKIYESNVSQIIDTHQENLLTLVKNVLDQYFQKQTTITNQFQKQIQDHYKTQQSSLNNYQAKLTSLPSSITENSHKLFQSLLQDNFGSPCQVNQKPQSYQNCFTYKMQSLQNQANGASSQTKQGCCQQGRRWFFQTYCKYSNDGAAYQKSMPTYWKIAKEISQQSIINNTKAITVFLTDISRQLKSNNSLPDKFLKIQMTYYDSIAKYPLNKTLISDTLSKCKSQAQEALSRVRCGSTVNLRQFISNIKEFQSFFSSYYDKYDEYNQKIVAFLSKFNNTIYNNLITNSKITTSTNQFLKEYYQQIQKINNNFINLNNLSKNYSPQQFVKNNKLATQIFGKYQQAINDFNQLCQNGQNQNMQIDNIRNEYKSISKSISQSSNDFFAAEVNEMVDIFNDISVNIFQGYKNTPFCQLYKNLEQKLQTLYPDFNNFTILYNLWSNFTDVKAWINVELQKYEQYGASLQGKFLQLFTPDGYNGFIKNINQTSFQFIQLIDNLRVKLSYVQQQSKNVIVFQSSQEEFKDSYKIFLNTKFSLVSTQIFDNMQQFTDKSFQAIKKLSFDVITVVVAARNIQQHYSQTIQNYNNGVQAVSGNFSNVCQSFINLNELVTQNYLNEINQNLMNIEITLNQTIFPNVTNGMEDIKDKFNNYTFTNQQMKKYFINSMNTLFQYTGLVDIEKKQLNDKFKQIYNEISEIINSLQIASLNSLSQIAHTLKKSFQQYVNDFKTILKQVSNFPKEVQKDFRNLFKLDQFLNNIQNNLEEITNSTSNTIEQKVSTKMESIAENSKFYQKLKFSQYYQPLTLTSKQGLKVNVASLKEDKEITSKIEQIKETAKQISGNVLQVMDKLSEAYKKIQNIKSNVQGKIQQIKNSIDQMKRKLFNLRNLIFISLQGEITDVIMTNIKAISKDIDQIVTVDFASLETLNIDGIVNNTIQKLVTQAVSKYNIVKNYKEIFILDMQSVLQRIDQFVKSKLTKKITKLKSGISFISSLENLLDSPKNHTLYKKQLWSQKAPIASYYQILPTAVGTFMLALNLDYSLSCQVLIQLSEYRNIYIGANFSASLQIDVTFSYGIAYILQFGIFVKGNVLRGDLKPMFLLTNAIPFQLVEALTGLQELQNQNKIDIFFIVDLGLYAVQLTIGFYFKYISLQIIWKSIRICISFLFVHFCISFKIPTGFKLTYRQKDFGHNVGGLVLVETRIVDLHLLTLKY